MIKHNKFKTSNKTIKYIIHLLCALSLSSSLIFISMGREWGAWGVGGGVDEKCFAMGTCQPNETDKF